MKKTMLYPAICLCLSFLTACAVPAAAPADNGEPPAAVSPPPGEETAYLSCRIVDGAEDGVLLLAELEESVYGGHGGAQSGRGVYRLCVTPDIPVTVDGEKADAGSLRDGMPVEIAFVGSVQETFPGEFGQVCALAGFTAGTRQSPGGGFYDLCGLYLQVLDDLWNKDSGLNEGIALASLDLSQAPGGLTESEKSALAWRFGELHGVEVLTAAWDELREQGRLTASAVSTPAPAEGENFSKLWYQWEDGCLFTIRPNEGHEGEVYSLPVLFFDAEKWRSPLGGYCFYDCSALWPETGTWSGYSIGGEMIS